MTKERLKVIKAELLCYGLRLDSAATRKIEEYNSCILERTLVHAMHIVIDELIINVCVSEKFCQLSPYHITYCNEEYYLMKDRQNICNIEIISLPKWCQEYENGYRIADYIRPHSRKCISCSPILKCGYYQIGKSCMFCSLNDFSSQTGSAEIIDPSTLAKMLFRALTYANYELNFSSGTILSEDKSANYYINVLANLKKLGLKKLPPISIEITPPDKDSYIQELADNGVTALIMNLEIVDDQLRKKICPGKSEISLNRYLEAMERAVCILGKGNVSSVLIAGIQPPEDIILMGKKLLSIGVIPTIMPFKPLDNCAMREGKVTNPDELLYINRILMKEIIHLNLNPLAQYGCTRCGGCSLETIDFLK